jgi:SAM-dependent methyltransferase
LSTLTGWPFWAPSDMESVEQALDLAELAEGEHLVDLGCGDGQVLVAGARRGSRVSGVECDEELVERARAALSENELPGEVELGDVFEFPLDDADVVFTYLAPATLQRLVDRFQALDGARLVTVDFAVPNLEPDEVDGQNHLYLLPASWSRPGEVGWQAAGVIVGVTPDRHSLTCLTVHHPIGSVTIETVDGMDGAAAVAVGADEVDREGDAVAVDLRWEELKVGTFVVGALRCDAVGDLPVFAYVSEDEEGLWEVTADGIDRLADKVAHGWTPSSFAELLAACDS